MFMSNVQQRGLGQVPTSSFPCLSRTRLRGKGQGLLIRRLHPRPNITALREIKDKMDAFCAVWRSPMSSLGRLVRLTCSSPSSPGNRKVFPKNQTLSQEDTARFRTFKAKCHETHFLQPSSRPPSCWWSAVRPRMLSPSYPPRRGKGEVMSARRICDEVGMRRALWGWSRGKDFCRRNIFHKVNPWIAFLWLVWAKETNLCVWRFSVDEQTLPPLFANFGVFGIVSSLFWIFHHKEVSVMRRVFFKCLPN